MTQRDFIIRQIAKTNKKNYENYVVTRIYHLLNRVDLKMITQQYVHRPDGHAMTDMYFPQLGIHVEIDEPFHEKQVELDLSREADIIKVTNHEIYRIKIKEDLGFINAQIDKLVNTIKSKIQNTERRNKWEPWDIDKEFNPDYYKKKGYLDVAERPAFRRMVDASNCLGQNYKNQQKAFVPSKTYPNHYLWYPKFYENEEWDNRINADGTMIIERYKKSEKERPKFKKKITNTARRITFPRSVDSLGFRLYRFAGIFEPDLENCSFETGMNYKLVETKLLL